MPYDWPWPSPQVTGRADFWHPTGQSTRPGGPTVYRGHLPAPARRLPAAGTQPRLPGNAVRATGHGRTAARARQRDRRPAALAVVTNGLSASAVRAADSCPGLVIRRWQLPSASTASRRSGQRETGARATPSSVTTLSNALASRAEPADLRPVHRRFTNSHGHAESAAGMVVWLALTFCHRCVIRKEGGHRGPAHRARPGPRPRIDSATAFKVSLERLRGVRTYQAPAFVQLGDELGRV